MTTPNPALAQLKDIHTPEAIGAWPLALGYWLALLVVILLITLLVYVYRNKKKQSLVKKEALNALSQLELNDNPEFAIQVNALLKRAALSYLPRNEVATIDGTPWYQFLDSTLPKVHQGKFNQLLNQRYSKQGLSDQEKQQLKELATVWMNKSLPLNDKARNTFANNGNKEARC